MSGVFGGFRGTSVVSNLLNESAKKAYYKHAKDKDSLSLGYPDHKCPFCNSKHITVQNWYCYCHSKERVQFT